MEVSVIIPTYKRVKDLRECLGSILNQSFAPFEILVIDNGRDVETKKTVLGEKEKFKKKSIKLEYIENKKENSGNVARNIGIRLAAGDIISLLDDDVILKEDYFEKTLKFFIEYKNALCVSGNTMGNLYEKNQIKFAIAQFLGKLFLLGFNGKKYCRVFPSLGAISPLGDKVIPSQWLSGASSSCRKSVFKEFSFDEKLKKYSWGDDVDFSYRIYKKYPNSLFFNPEIKFTHKVSKHGRIVGKERVWREEVYTLYLFYKLIPQNLKNKLAYVWGRIGRTIFRLLKFQVKDVFFSFPAFIFCIKNLRGIKKGDLEFFNKTIKKN